jgi:LysM repeat protein
VSKGDTFSSLAGGLGLSASVLEQANPGLGPELKQGQYLRLADNSWCPDMNKPSPPPSPASPKTSPSPAPASPAPAPSPAKPSPSPTPPPSRAPPPKASSPSSAPVPAPAPTEGLPSGVVTVRDT